MVSKALDLLKSARASGIQISVNLKGELQLKFAKGIQIEPELLQSIKDNKDLITSFLIDNKFKSKQVESYEKELKKADRESIVNIPLSFSQERLWFIDQLEGSLQYHLPTVLRLKGNLNKEALIYALQNVVNRHEVLRSVFREKDGQGYQYIKDIDEWQLFESDGGKFNVDPDRLKEYVDGFIRKPFDLANDYMLRAHLIKLDEQEHLLVVVMHHIASDGWSMSIIVKEVVELYNAYINKTAVRLEPLKLQYADFAIWQRRYLQGDVLAKKMHYWEQKLEGTPALQLPADFQRPAIQSTRGASTSFTIDRALLTKLNELSQQQEATLFMTLLAAFKILLFRYSGQYDISVGTPIAGRQYPEVEGLIGFFINTLVLRNKIKVNSSFIDWLQQVKSSTMEAYENQEVPFEKIVEKVVKERDMSRNPLFQVLFALQNTPEVPELRLGDLTLSTDKISNKSSKLDISFYLSETSQGIQGAVEYCTDLFQKQTVEQLICHYKQLLISIVEAPRERIGILNILSGSEELQLLQHFNNTNSQYQRDKTTVQLFEEQARNNPEAIALEFNDLRVTYRQLNERSNQLAHYLERKGIRQESIVPICMERGLNIIVGLLAIMKTGAVYVPIDPEYPTDRISYMLEDTRATILISSEESRSKLPGINNIQVIDIQAEWTEIEKEEIRNLQTAPKPQNLAYIIYTSGSTGKPKGVMIEHRSLVNLLTSMAIQTNFKQGSCFFAVTTFSFDICYLEFYMPLIYGGKLIVVPRDVAIDGYKLAERISHYRPTHMQGTPSTWQLLLEADWNNTESLIMLVGGEAVKESLKNQLTKIGLVYNVYGPTETTIWSASKKLESDQKVVLGHPLANTSIYILSSEQQLCPPKVAGEICIGGDGLARGYLNRPELTAEKFIRNPFSHDPHSKLYRTGDLGRWLPDGNVEFLGRLDDQVKIRGYRIELGEIESILQQSSHVRQAVVNPWEDNQGNKNLVGYIVPDGKFNLNAIIEYLKEKLPDYMVPLFWIELESVPLTANGKINRKALPDPVSVDHPGNEYVAPRTSIEIALANIWQQLLSRDAIGINDNFFQLGGHSLLAMRAISLIRKKLEIEVGIKDLFLHPTIAELGSHLKEINQKTLLPAIIVQPREESIPLSFSQERLWFIDRLEGSLQYHMYSVLRLQGTLNKEALQYALQEIVSRHEVLRTVFTENDGHVLQNIIGKDGWKLSTTDGSKYSADSKALKKSIEKIISQPFDLASDYMLRANLVTINNKENVLVVTMHHIASDGWSLGVIVREVSELYNAYNDNREAQLKPLTLQYADFAIWQRRYLHGEILATKMNYWKRKLQDAVVLQLPTDYPRPQIQSTRGALKTFSVDKEISESIQKFSQNNGCTVFMTLLAAFKVLLHRYSGQEDICVGTPIAGRQQQDVEELIGFFVNTLALRTEVKGNYTFLEHLQHIKTTTLEAYENQEVPFEKVVDAVVRERDMSRTPLFQVMLVLQNNAEIPTVQLGDVTLSADNYQHTSAMFDMTFFMIETPAGLKGRVEYCIDLYSEQTIVQLITHFKELLCSGVKFPERKIGSLPMITEADEFQLLYDFNKTTQLSLQDKTIVDLFEEQVERTPGAVAVIFDNIQLTYRQLNERANQLARYLLQKGVRQESLVPICVERSHEMIVGILGILKAGGAYVPIDPGYPDERIAYMLDDTKAAMLVTSRHSTSKIPGLNNFDRIELDSDWSLIEEQPKNNLDTFIGQTQLAYIIYTSGSTGKPKGVMIEHASVYTFISWCQREFASSQFDIVYAGTSMCFDLSIYEIFYPLSIGKKLRVIENGLHIAKYLPADSSVLTNSVPSVILSLLKEGADLRNISVMNMAGEPIPVQVQENLDADKIEIRNLYGPTEDTTYSTIFRLKNNSPVLIGKPISNTQVYIVNKEMQLVPAGVAGEICIAGAGLARGYLNRPELTTEKFISNPFNEDRISRLYKTGDLGRWLQDGNIEYLGRLDHQVKIRGYRIELGEIENVMQQCELVNEAVVMTREEKEGTKRLVAYLVPDWQAVKSKERELYYRQVANWRELYETEYEKTQLDNDIDKEFNIIGWNDSFAGGAIPAEQMKEWLQDIVKIIFSENPGNVLEIGCGTGLIYYQLAGKVKKYIGTDFSRSSINQINQWISIGHRDYGETELHVCAAHEITLKENQVVDTIIINSVVQYFPGEDYLNEVIKKSISVLNGKGRIIIGDVRDNRLLELFKCRLQLQKLQESLSIKEYKWIVDQEILKEEELCFSPEYFYNLQSWYPQITGVEIQWKQSSFINELTLYRYNVILHVGKEPAMFDPQWQHWSETNSNEIIEKLELGSATIAIKDVPNHRLWQEQLLSQNLVHRSEGTVGELVQALRIKDKDSVAIEQLLNFATARGYHYRLLLDEDPLKQNLLFEINPATGFIKQAYSDNGYTSTTQLTNIPLFTNIASLFQKEIRALLQQRLPDYMVPSEFITLGRLPLTSNGKIDRRFLSRREDKSVANKLNYEPPATELEQALASIWKELLGIDRVGIHDDFFELGGHSLLATRAVSAVRRRLNVELTIKDLFTHSTIAGLIEYFASQNRVVLPPIKVEPRTEFIPLSFSQERLWFIDRLEGSVQYHIPAVLRLKGSLDKKALLFSLQTIVNRHEVLRTVIREQDGHPSQVIKDKNQWNLVSVDGSQYRHHDTGLKQYIERVIREPFDLAKDFMLRATLVAIDEQEHILIVTMHHIASDGWSLSIIVKEIAELYEAAVHHRPPVLPTLHVQYADFAIWQRRYIQGELLDKKMNYWKEKLADVAALQIPTDYPRPAIQSSKGDVLAFIISKELLAKLNLLSQEHGVTLFMTLLSAFKVLMHQYTSQQDICVGTSIAGRQQEEIEGLIGFFINSLALRSEVKSTASFTELLQQVKVTTLEAYENQEVPFERVVDAVVKERDLSRNPLFQVLFALQNIPEVPNLSLGDIVLSQENFEHTTTQFDLTFRITETPSGLVSSVEYCTDLFHKQTIRRMLNHFEKLLDSIVTNPQQKIAELSILSKEEEDEILVAFNDTFSAYPKHLSLVGLFEEKAMAVPRNKAVVFGDLHLTYEELDKRSNQLAHHLISKGIIPGSNVGLMSMRKPEMIIGLFGILKAGCAYVPFNMEYPTERLNFIIEDAGITHVVLTDTNLIGSLCLDEHAFINIEESSSKSVEPVALKTGINARAYIMYTSGTTGTPKGIAVSHQNIIKLVYEQREIAVRTDDHVLQWSNYAFDGSTYEIYSSLLQGASLHLIKESAASDVFELSEIIKNQHITVSFVTTALFNTFIDVSPQSLIGLRKILFGGEMVSLSHVRKALSVLGTDKIIHVYGPTETTVYATYYCVNSIAGNGTIPIGRPLSNTQLYVLNNLQKLVPVGVAGELFIGGDGVSFGYLNKNALTTEKFVPDPFTNVGKLYKTGDRVRWLDDGTIEFLGRFDQQVKIRGYRIELGEIESVLQQSKLVRQAVVIAKEDKEGTKSLVAYVVPQADFDRDSITIYLKDKLPEYMVPSVWVELESLPLNSNGKVDKKALPEPDASDLLVNEHVAPRTELEKTLAIIWQDLLDLETVGIHDNFFEIGGHSLLAIRLISVIRKELSTEVPISEIFEYPTIAELATSLNKPSEVVALPTIKAETRPELIPLSFSQERLWFIDQLEGSVQYHLPAVFKLKGRVDTTALEHTLKTIVNRHEVLRTVFRHQDGQPWQKIKEKDGWHLSVLDSFQTEPRQLIDRLIKEPFDLSKDHMLRASLIKLSEEEHLLVVTMHHIASDGWSTSVMVKEVSELYNAYVQGRTSELANLAIQYADFSIWQRQYLQGEVLDEKMKYWKEKLAGVAPLELPTDFVRPAVWSSRGAMAPFNIEKNVVRKLHLIGQEQGTTLFMTLLSAVKVLLHRYTGQNDICVGTGIAGRQQQEVENLIGFFINTLALRTEVKGEASFTDLLHEVKATTLGAYQNQEVPFEKVVDAVTRTRDMSRNPIFQVMFVLQNTPEVPRINLGDLELERLSYEHTTAQFDLSFSLTEHDFGLSGSLEYNSDLYNPETINRLLVHFKQLVTAIAHDPRKEVSKLSIMSKAEEQHVLFDLNANQSVYPKDKTIIELFEEQVEANPHATALVFEDKKLSYLQLNKHANQLAHYLRARGVVAGGLIPICIERSVEMIVGIMGILKTGCAYVPLDPGYPQSRISYMLEDTGATLVVSSTYSKPRLNASEKIDIIELDADNPHISEQPTHDLNTNIKATDLAYIIYTSGSTGTPKGVMVEHRNVVSLVKGVDYLSLDTHDVLLSTGSFSFDATTVEYWGMLLNGGQLIICNEHTLLNSKLLKEEIKRRAVTKMWFTSSWFNELVETDIQIFEPLQTILVGGEKLSERHIKQVKQCYPLLGIINGYGPTENTTFSVTYDIIDSELQNSIPIGKPLNNRYAYILDSNLQPVPVGVPGEICLGGAGLSRGYLNRPELTAEKFVPNPFSTNEPEPRLYRTGDLGRWLADGNIEYLGRLDDQVKIRGYRIELGEIENVLQQSNLIRQAVVMVRQDNDGNKRLVAYTVSEGELEREGILSYLKEKLPDYMIPSLWVELERLPLTANGKVDKKALPDAETGISGIKYVAPRTELEMKLVKLWEELLKVEKVGIEDNFFELGGHSLLAMRMVSYIERNLQISIPIQVLFKFSCISDLSKYLDIQAGKNSQEKNSTSFELFDV